MKKDLTNQQLLLAEYMSDISERCYYAGWIQDLEYVLWDAVLNGERKYGHDTISPNDIEILRDLSQAANIWIFFDDIKEETAIDLQDWKKKSKRTFNKTLKFLKVDNMRTTPAVQKSK